MIINLEGQIDSSNADEYEADINKQIENADDLIFDFENLQYLSSAGLRIFLKISKKFPKFRIINANNQIYDVFDMTGFNKMINIQKKRRKVSIDGLTEMAHGGSGIVYKLDDENLIKVFRDGSVLEEVERERELSQLALRNHLPTAIAYDVVDVDGKYGVIYEIINGKQLTDVILNNEADYDEVLESLANLARDIHKVRIDTDIIPSKRANLKNSREFMKNFFNDDEIEHMLKLIDIIPDRDTLIHGDIHTANVLYKDGELQLIDMGDVGYGHPLIDLGHLFIAYEFFHPVATKIQDHKTARRVCDDILKKYFKVDQLDDDLITVLFIIGIFGGLERMSYGLARHPEIIEKLTVMLEPNRHYLKISEEDFKTKIDKIDKELF